MKEKAMAELKEAPRPRAENGAGQKKELTPRGEATPQRWAGSPFHFMRRFAEEMDRLFADFGMHSGWQMPGLLSRGQEFFKRELGLVPADWTPEIDVRHRDGNLVVRVDLPGLTKDEVKVEVTEQMLTIQGERKHEKKEEHEGYYYSERGYGSFYRAVPLPTGVDAAKATAEFKNGVLEVTMPAAPEPAKKVRRLEVREVK
jgi:HSP20 family protein